MALGTVENLVKTKLDAILKAVDPIRKYLVDDVLSQVSKLPQGALDKVVTALSELSTVQELALNLANGLLDEISTLVSSVTKASQGLLGPVLGSLANTLKQVTKCTTCLTSAVGRRR